MSTTPSFQAVYENGVLRPLEPLALPEHQVVSLTILPAGTANDVASANPSRQADVLEAWLDEVSRLPLEGPDDGLSNRDHDQILYGKPT
jgi:predicted DNA-binding antitoxin AbrB/MazE fold protein